MWRKIIYEPCEWVVIKTEEIIKNDYPWFKINILQCKQCRDYRVELAMKDIGIDSVIRAYEYESLIEALVKLSKLRDDCLNNKIHDRDDALSSRSC